METKITDNVFTEILDFAKEILEIPSPSGYTKNIINHLVNICKENGYTHEVLNNGNLLIEVKGSDDYVLGLTCHVDTLGAMVSAINNDGTLKFSVVGGPILPTYDGEYCTVYTRSGNSVTGTFLSNAPAVHVHKDARTLPRNEETMHIRLDELVHSKQDVLNLGICNGDFIALDPKTQITPSGFIKSRFLDDKLSVAIVFRLLKFLKAENVTPKHTLKIVISTLEEVGSGASYMPKIDEMLAIDMGCVGNYLEGNEEKVSICAKDSSGPYNYDMNTKLIELARKENLDYAVDVFPYYSSDVSAALKGGNNIKGALIGSGVAASHGMERTHLKGVTNTFKLLLAYILN